MNNKFTIDELTVWIAGIIECAKRDESCQVYWFVPTMRKPFSIVAGWQKMFTEDYSYVFCCSKSKPEYVMCIKVVENDEQYCPDFDSLKMPINKHFEEVDDTSVPLEWDDNPKAAAEFFMHEWERIMAAHGEEV